MPEAENEPGELSSGGKCSVPDDEGMDLNSLAQTEVEVCVKEFRDILNDSVLACASNDDCDEAQVKHVRAARLAVFRMAPPDNGIGTYSLLGGLFFAIALAIPDTSMIWFGDPGDGFLWGMLKLAVGVCILLGVCFSSYAFYISLGPHQPKWILGVRRWLGNFQRSKP